MKILGIEVNGLVRKLDQLNRVVVPKEMCNELNLKSGSKVEIFWSKKEKAIVIKEATHEND